jgi:alkanesulfonate monooxygenase SsuD/methylene tetrahydromethanopterin reductase-like flavin-dependent oxidoreductase (luciferase family)
MEVGVGLPSGVPGAAPDAVVEWARRADAGPFGSVGVIDRFVYDNYEPLVALSAAAAVTERVQLVTCILITPLRELASLAKQVVSLDALSRGRLTLGVAIGARGDDYERSEFGDVRRGDRLTGQLTRLRTLWEEGVMTPTAAPREAPTILVGGTSGPAYARMARLADGYVHNGGPPRAFAKAAEQARTAWSDQGRPGRPQLWGQGYYALGGAEEEGRRYLLDYYAFTGAFAQRIADGLLTTPLAVREFVQGYADAGCDHLVLLPTVSDPEQVDLLAEALHA